MTGNNTVALPEQFTRAPIIDLVNERQLALLRSKAANLTNAELAAALELAAAYDLDPWANEIWFAKSKNGRLLIMVGRDGLRKIAGRNGLVVDGDVVRANDAFKVIRAADRSRTIEHTYGGSATDRGEIVGAWAECYERDSGRQLGFFFAPVGEYMPDNPDSRSPWANQASVMMLAAAERQAVRQATPLGGLLVEGEAERNIVEGAPAHDAEATAVEFQQAPSELVDSTLATIDEVLERGVWGALKLDGYLVAAGASSTETVEAALRSMTPEAVEALRNQAADLLAAADESTEVKS